MNEDQELWQRLYYEYAGIKDRPLREAVSNEFDRLHCRLGLPEGEALQAALLCFKLIPDPRLSLMEGAAAMEAGALEYEEISRAEELMGL